MRTLLVLALVFSTAAQAQRRKEDAPIPYEDERDADDDRRHALPKRSEPSRERPEEPEIESKDGEKSLASEDDPNIGLSLEIVAAALLLDSSRAAGVEGLGL